MAELTELAQALVDGNKADANRLVREKLDAGVSAPDIIAECNQGMVQLGERFTAGEVFLPQLMFSGMIMKEIMTLLGPALDKEKGSDSIGTVVMGSVQHDVHDIGKDIVIMMLRSVGFEVIDLGVDVSPEKFVEAVREHKPAVVGMSVLLTTCYKSVTETVKAIQEAGLRDDVRIMLGGAAASELVAENAGCDRYGKTAVDGLNFAREVVGIAS